MLGTGDLRRSNSEVAQPKELPRLPPGVWDLSKDINYLHEDKTRCFSHFTLTHCTSGKG